MPGRSFVVDDLLDDDAALAAFEGAFVVELVAVAVVFAAADLAAVYDDAVLAADLAAVDDDVVLATDLVVVADFVVVVDDGVVDDGVVDDVAVNDGDDVVADDIVDVGFDVSVSVSPVLFNEDREFLNDDTFVSEASFRHIESTKLPCFAFLNLS